jgi:flagellar biosynthetic protein FliR
VACLVLVDLGLGIAARSLPQLNIFLLGIPVKLLAGLAALAAWAAAASQPAARAFEAMFRGLEGAWR